ncbi:MAG: UvrD-helicase domain-containing protein, partial [Treponema sp.]|nr:UvrD-helicase domain-containing protein [Treponema sp.]
DNAVVAAGAGSGKTMVLANRFVRLLTEKGYKVDEILTLTFTKKAAAQMYSRIYSLVSDIAQQETGIKAQRAKAALDDFVHARIQTLDSYSASIVRQCSMRYGISPDFNLDQDRCYNLALDISYPFLIANRHHPAIEKLYCDNRPVGIIHNIFADVLYNYCYIDKPRNFLADIKIQYDSVINEWKKYFSEIKIIIKELKRDIGENDTLLPVLVPVIQKYNKIKIDIPKASEVQEYLNILFNTPVDSVIEISEKHFISSSLTKLLFCLDSLSNLNLRGGKRLDNPVKENIKKLREMISPVFSLSFSCMQAGFIISTMTLLSELQKRYLERKRSEGVLTFKDVASLSRTILIQQQDIRQSEKETFKAIMIDEFQDNNELQKDILFILAEKLNINNKGVPSADDLCSDKLFFVGDEKQSIYLFRGADVSVFRRLKDEIKSRDLPLRTNYRSDTRLINIFNIIFGGSSKPCDSVHPSVFAPVPKNASSGQLPLYEADYSPLEAGKKTESTGNFSLCILNKNNINDNEDKNSLLSSDESEARFVAEKIKHLLNGNYKPNDIAVLFRSRTHQYLYEKHLRSLGIPYTCEDINDLFYGGLVNDIISVLRLVSHPIDRASYAEMLRSPFAGLTLPGTAVCLSFFCDDTERCEPFDNKPLLQLDESDRIKYLCGQKIYYVIRKKAESGNICSLVSELWYNQGYRYETEWSPQLGAYRQLFDYLFHLAANADAENQSLSAFTDYMVSFRNKGGQLPDTEIPLEQPDAVHLMTIHKSKGLEFPVVFLCSCGNKGMSDRCDSVYFSEKAGVVLSPPPPLECRSISGKLNNFFWEQANEEIKRKRTAELRRLLYVGMTRAENELFLTGSLDMKSENGINDFSLILKNYIEKKCENNENYIEDDSIINNDTLFGLLLPAIVSHIPHDGLKKGSGFLNLEEIKCLSQEYIKNEESKNTGNTRRNINEFINETESYYEKAQIITTPELKDNHITPVSLKNKEADDDNGMTEKADDTLGRGYFIHRRYSGKDSDDVFKKVDSIILHLLRKNDDNSERFNSGSFGTIAHICVEACLNGEEPLIPSNISGLLSPAQMKSLLEAGMELAKRFLLSPLGKIAETTHLRENEFSFRTYITNKEGKEIFINGTVDLFFEDEDAIHVVDFKTDTIEKPAEHIAQISCYHLAISTLYAVPLKKRCRVWLYYLRTGHAVEMTEKACAFNLEQRAFNND